MWLILLVSSANTIKELLAMKDEAEGKNRVREPSEKEGS
jgi:hypothetical protein